MGTQVKLCARLCVKWKSANNGKNRPLFRPKLRLVFALPFVQSRQPAGVRSGKEEWPSLSDSGKTIAEPHEALRADCRDRRHHWGYRSNCIGQSRSGEEVFLLL